jgi:hypothetical protein
MKRSRFSEEQIIAILKHTFPGSDMFQHRLQLSELDYLTRSHAASTALAENYVGLPLP